MRRSIWRKARNAVELARLAGADRYAADTFGKAVKPAGTAEQAREKRRGSNEIMMPARQAAQTAEDARLVGLQRQEEALAAEQQRIAAAREQEAVTRAQAEEARRRQAELDAQNAAAARQAAERQSQEAAARAQQALAEQDAAKRAKAEADAARTEAENARAQADAARRDAEAQAAHARQLAAQSEQEKAQLRDQLRQQLSVILETRETARGLIVNLSDVLFDTARHDLKPGAREKLARVSGILSAHPGLKMEIEGHTDSVGTDEYNQNLSERRAESVRSYLVSQNIAPAMVTSIGFGESKPVATNDTAAGQATESPRRADCVGRHHRHRHRHPLIKGITGDPS